MRFSRFEPKGRLKQQIRFQTTFLSTSHHGNQTKAVHRHTHVGSTAGKTIIRSGGDTTLKGAQLIGKGVQADTRNLHIESVQDTETYQGKQQNGNVQVTVGYGLSAGGSYSRSKIRADHASVTEQSGIYAGEDGYQIKVRDNTDLKGGIITSSQSAEDKGKNLFQTATLTHSDIQNHSRYEGKSFGIGGSFDLNGGWDGTVTDKQGRPADRISPAIGYGSDGDGKNSTTRSGINTSNMHITDEAGQLARTGGTAEETEARIYTGIDTETAAQHTGRLKNSFEKDAVAKEINLQREVTQEFGKNAAQAAAAAADKLGNTRSYERYQAAKTLLEAELQNTDSETEKAAIRATLGQVNAYLSENQSRYDTWKEGGIGRSMLHGAAGGLTTGSLGGILAGSGTSLAAPYLDKAAENLGPAGKAAVNALGGAAIGYAAGGNAGTAAVGANVDWHNRQLHPSEYKLAEQYADIVASRLKISREEALGRIIRHMQRTVDYATAKADNFRTDDAIISILGANNLPKQDQHYTNPNYNKQYIQNYVRDFNLANKYNYFGKMPTQSRDYKVGVVTDIGKAALNSGIGIFESAANLATGEIDPNSWAYVHMGRIGYTHPEYGNALENTMTLGVAAVTAGRTGTQAGKIGTVKPSSFANESLLNDHFIKHGAEFNVKNEIEYLKIGQDTVNKGIPVQYDYNGSKRTGYVQFLGTDSKGQSKFIFVGTNENGSITTIHTKSGKNFWRTLNNNPKNKTIYPKAR